MDVPAIDELVVRQVRWSPCFRIIASRLPTIYLFERVAEARDFDALYALEAMTNPRLLAEREALDSLPAEDRAFGPGSSVIMAPFMYLNPDGSRFTDSTFGAFHAARTLTTAIAETRHHREVFLRATHEAALELTMRSYLVDVSAKFHDLRGMRRQLEAVYDPDSYATSQVLGRNLHQAGSNGIVFESVRDPQGECLAIFKARLIKKLRQGVHLRYVWDGASITHVYELRPIS